MGNQSSKDSFIYFMNPSSSSIMCTIEDPAGTLAFAKANVRKITEIVERPCLSIFNYPLVDADYKQCVWVHQGIDAELIDSGTFERGSCFILSNIVRNRGG